MEEIISEVIAYFSTRRLMLWGSALAVFLIGLFVAHWLSVLVGRITARRAGDRHAIVMRRVTHTLLLVLCIGMTLSYLGFDLKVLLGAAGILTVAIGFAAQTSASNIISGLFLLGERPFVVGDFLQIGETTGEVVAIDLLSVRIRTFDNLAVRVPNETLLKTTFTNLTHFPVRRLDLQVRVGMNEDVERVREVLMEVARANPLCLDEPQPLFIFKGFGDSMLEIQFSVWVVREKFIEVRNSMYGQIKAAFNEVGIEVPLPQRVLHIAEASKSTLVISKSQTEAGEETKAD